MFGHWIPILFKQDLKYQRTCQMHYDIKEKISFKKKHLQQIHSN